MAYLLSEYEDLIDLVKSIPREEKIGIVTVTSMSNRDIIHLGHSFLLGQMAEVFKTTIFFVLDNKIGNPDPDESISEIKSKKNYKYLNCDYVFVNKNAYSINVINKHKDGYVKSEINKSPIIEWVRRNTTLPISEWGLLFYLYWNTSPDFFTRWNETFKIISEIGKIHTIINCKGNRDLLSDLVVYGIPPYYRGYIETDGIDGIKKKSRRWQFPTGYLPDGSEAGSSYKTSKTEAIKNHIFSYVNKLDIHKLKISELEDLIKSNLHFPGSCFLTTIKGMNPTEEDIRKREVILVYIPEKEIENKPSIEVLWLGFPPGSVFERWPKFSFLKDIISSSFYKFYLDKENEERDLFNISPVDFEDKMIKHLKNRFNYIRGKNKDIQKI